MATVDDLRKLALVLPETTEGTHFQLVAFRVADQAFIGIEKDNRHATFSLAPEGIAALTVQTPGLYGESRRNGKSLIGVRVELKRSTAKQLKHLVGLSGRKKAPKKLAAATNSQALSSCRATPLLRLSSRSTPSDRSRSRRSCRRFHDRPPPA